MTTTSSAYMGASDAFTWRMERDPYVAGSKVTGMFAFGPTIGTSLNTTLLSYAGTCDIGINIDTAAVPDPQVLLDCLQESAAEITALGAGG